MGIVSNAERAYVLEGLEQGVRNDGRGVSQFRELSVQCGVLQQASGSARCQLGATEAVVAIKVGASRLNDFGMAMQQGSTYGLTSRSARILEARAWTCVPWTPIASQAQSNQT